MKVSATASYVISIAIGWLVFDIATHVGSTDPLFSLGLGSAQAARWATLSAFISLITVSAIYSIADSLKAIQALVEARKL